MKHISSDFGSSVQLFVMEEIRPPAGIYSPDLYAAIIDRYRFVTFPTDIPASIANGAKFQVGAMGENKNTISIAELGIYNDGIVINSRNTDASDAVMDDFLPWVADKFGFKDPITIKPRLHASNVVVEFDASINGLIKDFAKIAAVINPVLSKARGQNFDINVSRLTLGADPETGLQANQSSITIEPRAGVPFSQLRYFSGAPLKTEVHLELLESIEKMLLS